MKRLKLLDKKILIVVSLLIGGILYTQQNEQNPIMLEKTKKIHTVNKEKNSDLSIQKNIAPNNLQAKRPSRPLQYKWAKKFEKELLQFQEHSTSVEIFEEKKLDNNQSVLLITFKKITNEKSSFHALINNKNGKILKTFDFSIVENHAQGAI